MKLKKLIAGVTAAALSVGLVAVTPLMTSAEDEADTLPLKTWTLDESGSCESDAYTFSIPTEVASSVKKLDIVFTDVTTDYLKLALVQDGGYMNGGDWESNYKNDYFETQISGGKITKTVEFGVTLNANETPAANALTGFKIEDTQTNISIAPNWLNAGSVSLSKVICYNNSGAAVYTEIGDLDEPKTTTTLWEGSTAFGNWESSVIISKDKFAPFKAGGTVKVTMSECSADAQYGTRYIDTEWVEMIAYSSGLSAGETSFSFKLSDADLELVKAHDFVVAGHDMTVTKVEYICYTKDVESSVPVESVTISGAPAAAMEIGDTAALTAEVLPENATDNTVAWTSSDSAVAAVDENGVVTAKAAGTADITAAAGGVDSDPVTITVKAAIVPVTATITPDEVTVYSAEASAQAADVKNKLTVTVAGADGKAIASSNYTVDVTVDAAAAEAAPSAATVKVALTDKAKESYSMTDVIKEVAVKYEDKVPAVYQGYDIKTDLEVEADTEAEAAALIEDLVKDQVLTLKGANGAEDWTYGKVGANLKNISVGAIADGKCTVTADIDMAAVRLPGDIYVSADSSITLGDSAEVSTKTESVTFTVTVTLPDEPTPDEPTPDEPTPDEPKPDEPKPDEPKPDEPKPDEPKPDEPKPDEPKPDEPTPDTPSVPAVSVPRIGEGVVPTDINSGAAVTGTKAIEAAAAAKPGDRIDVVMIGIDNSAEVIEKIADKENVVVNLRYVGYIVSINSDDVAEDFDANNFYSAARFLTKGEQSAFAQAKEVRQIKINSWNGIDKVTISVIMRGGSKGLPATALNRTAAGRYQEVASGKVGEDRTFSFEVTKPGNYVVYSGDVSFGD